MFHFAPSSLGAHRPSAVPSWNDEGGSALRSRSILLVDDDEIDRILFVSALKRIDPYVTCITMPSADHAMRWLAENRADLAIVDLRMPGKSGFELIEDIRHAPEHSEMPITVLSTSSAENDRRRAIDLGAVRYFTKPASRAEYGTLASEFVAMLDDDDGREM